jgi:hypothetical protein
MTILFFKMLFVTCLSIFIMLVIINEILNYIIKHYNNKKWIK